MVQLTPPPGADLAAGAPTPTASVPVSRPSRSRWVKEVGWRHLVGVVAVLWALFPISYIVSAALNPAGSVTATSVIPTSASLANFKQLFDTPSIPFGRWYLNTVVVCVAVTLVQIFFSALAAYAFSRFRFRGRRGGLLTLLLIQMFPQFLAAVALYTMLSSLGEVVPALGLNTLLGYAVVLCGGSLGQVWLIKGFFDSVPRSLDEAAMMDGAGHAQTYFRIVLPLVRPILAVSGLLVFVSVIGEFLLASIFLTDNNEKTLSVGLYGLIAASRSQNLGVFAAGALLTAIPVIALFLYLQKFIVGGITAGGVKE
jgi:arabinogalactan oligomer/maltooligosaccharide transport system permease protein